MSPADEFSKEDICRAPPVLIKKLIQWWKRFNLECNIWNELECLKKYCTFSQQIGVEQKPILLLSYLESLMESFPYFNYGKYTVIGHIRSIWKN